MVKVYYPGTTAAHALIVNVHLEPGWNEVSEEVAAALTAEGGPCTLTGPNGKGLNVESLPRDVVIHAHPGERVAIHARGRRGENLGDAPRARPQPTEPKEEEK